MPPITGDHTLSHLATPDAASRVVFCGAIKDAECRVYLAIVFSAGNDKEINKNGAGDCKTHRKTAG